MENIQKLVENITHFENKEKSMMADEFVSFVHKIQDVIQFTSLFSDEESKSQVDLDWIWKNIEDAPIQPPAPLFNKPPII